MLSSQTLPGLADSLASRASEHSYVFCFKGTRLGITKYPNVYLFDPDTEEVAKAFQQTEFDENMLAADGYLGDHTEEIDYEVFVALNRQNDNYGKYDEDEDEFELSGEGYDFLRFEEEGDEEENEEEDEN